MKKQLLLTLLLSSLVLTGCNSNKKYDIYSNRRDEDVLNVYSGDKNDFHISSWFASDFGQIETDEDNGVYTISYQKNITYEYTNIYTTVMGPLADFTYLNFHAKGTPGKSVTFRAYYGQGDAEYNNVLGGDFSFSLTEEYMTHSLKVKNIYKTRMDLLSRVCIFPEIGSAGIEVMGTFTFDDVWFSSALPEGSRLENPGVDSGDTSVRVNGWTTDGWTLYTLYDAGNGHTGVKYTSAAEWATIEKDIEIPADHNGLRFTFENLYLSGKPSVTCIRFILRGDVSEHVTEGVEYDYYLYYEGAIYAYDLTKEDEVQPDENGLTTLELSLENAISSIGNHHENGYRLTLFIESNPDDVAKFRRYRDGQMIIHDVETFKGSFITEKYTEYGSTVYTLSEKEGVDQNITYTNVSGNAYWPRVCRHIKTSKTDTIKLVMRNNGENSVLIVVHAGIMTDDRSDAKNNMFYPLWHANGKSPEGYYTDGADYTIEPGATQEVSISVDSSFTDPNDVIDVIQFVIDASYNDTQKRSGNIDIVSVEIIK